MAWVVNQMICDINLGITWKEHEKRWTWLMEREANKRDRAPE